MKKIILFIVEGKTEKTSLKLVLDNLVSEKENSEIKCV